MAVLNCCAAFTLRRRHCTATAGITKIWRACGPLYHGAALLLFSLVEHRGGVAATVQGTISKHLVWRFQTTIPAFVRDAGVTGV